MTQQDGERLLKIIDGFLDDDMGNRITKWNATAFGQTMQVEINKIIQKDNKENLEKINKKIIPM